MHTKKIINGKALFVNKHITRHENDHQIHKSPPITQAMKETFEANIYVRFIPKDLKEDEFKKVMEIAGTIISLKLRDYEQKNSLGETFVNYQVAYVCYSDIKMAQRCIQIYDQSTPFGLGKKSLKIDFWQSRYDLANEKEEKNLNQVKGMISMIK